MSRTPCIPKEYDEHNIQMVAREKPTPTLVWVDVETTGLSVVDDHLLEIAVVLTDYSLVDLVLPGGRPNYFSRVINPELDHPLAEAGERIKLPLKVVRMHMHNGLLDDLSERGKPVSTVLEELVQFLREARVPLGDEYPTAPKPMWAGECPHFDRSFIKNAGQRLGMDRIDRHFSHKHFDYTAMMQLVSSATGTVPRSAVPTSATNEHRALPDVLRALQFARYIRRKIKEVGAWP